MTCEITNNVISAHTHTQDVLIGNLADKSQSIVLNDVTKCIGMQNAIVVSDLKITMTQKNLKTASVVILLLDRIDFVSKLENLCDFEVLFDCWKDRS